MNYYLNKNFATVIEAEYALDDNHGSKTAVIDGLSFGTTYPDYMSGSFITLSTDQIAFWRSNTSASAKEIIEMEMSPPPEPPSFDEQKQNAFDAVGRKAVSRIEELFPLSVMRDVIFGRLSEEEVAQLHIDYNNAITALGSALVDAHDRIDNAVSVDDTQSAVEDFSNQAIYVVSDREGSTIVDALVDAGRIVRNEENRRTFN